MTHKFDIEIAQKVGVNAAILYDNIVWWCMKNKASETNFFDGRHWTYNSVKAWRELFPYLTTSSIKTALKKLEESGLILTGSYNRAAYDRTKWYSYSGQIHLSEIANGKENNSQPIPSNKPSNKPAKRKPPTLEEIIAYKEEKNLSVDAYKFFDYFDAGNWYDSKGNKVKNWKQKMLTWNNHNTSNTDTSKKEKLWM